MTQLLLRDLLLAQEAESVGENNRGLPAKALMIYGNASVALLAERNEYEIIQTAPSGWGCVIWRRQQNGRREGIRSRVSHRPPKPQF